MTRIDKLDEHLLTAGGGGGGTITFRDFVTLIEAFGFRHARTKGSHRSYDRPSCPRPLGIQPKRKEANRYQLRQFPYDPRVWPTSRAMTQHRYNINVFWSAEDGCWIADVPDLRPCSAHGDTPGEAIAEAEVAIELWLETAKEHGPPIPEASYRPAIYAAG